MNKIVRTEKDIKCIIFNIRNTQVILASDVAKLYQVETKRINEVVKRNINRFPNNFCFQLTQDEFNTLRSQNATSNITTKGGVRYLPYVFTEHGIMMLSGLLKSDVAVRVNVLIINAFIEMKKYLSEELLEQKYYKNLVLKHEEEIKIINETLNKFESKELEEQIFFEGSIYDAYSKLIDIMNKAKKELIIVDNYADKNVLDMVSKIKTNTILITKEKGILKELDIKKYNEQYHNLKIIYNNSFHDRYIIIDKEIIYHCGTSLNKAGNKTFSLNKLKDIQVINCIITEINNIIK